METLGLDKTSETLALTLAGITFSAEASTGIFFSGLLLAILGVFVGVVTAIGGVDTIAVSHVSTSELSSDFFFCFGDFFAGVTIPDSSMVGVTKVDVSTTVSIVVTDFNGLTPGFKDFFDGDDTFEAVDEPELSLTLGGLMGLLDDAGTGVISSEIVAGAEATFLDLTLAGFFFAMGEELVDPS